MARAGVPIEQIRELRLAAAGFRDLPSAAQQRITKRMRTEFLPMLGREVVNNARMFGAKGDVQAAADQRFYTGTNPGIGIGVGKRMFSNGATSATLIRGMEFGAIPVLWTKYRGVLFDKGPQDIKRHATHQFPAKRDKGWIVYPAIAEFMPKMAAAWIGMVADMIREQIGE